jgi:ABC-type amino acid transport substrate-binding protein
VDADIDQVFAGIAQGEHDLGAGTLTITSERSEVVAFTRPHFVDRTILITRKGAGIESLDDLTDGLVGVAPGTAYEELMRTRYPDIALHLISDSGPFFESLEDGSIDAILTTGADGDPGLARFHPVLAVGPAPSSLLDDVNSLLDELIADGTYRTIYDPWFDSPENAVDG